MLRRQRCTGCMLTRASETIIWTIGVISFNSCKLHLRATLNPLQKCARQALKASCLSHDRVSVDPGVYNPTV